MKRDEEEKRELCTRLHRIEGQIRGIHKMIEDERYCIDILTQISAARAALDKTALQILRTHTRGCIAEAIREERGEAAVDELIALLSKFIK